MSLDALTRRAMHDVYMRDPVMRSRLYDEACVRHSKYFAHLASQGELTADIILDHLKMLHWYFNEGGWRR